MFSFMPRGLVRNMQIGLGGEYIGRWRDVSDWARDIVLRACTYPCYIMAGFWGFALAIVYIFRPLQTAERS